MMLLRTALTYDTIFARHGVSHRAKIFFRYFAATPPIAAIVHTDYTLIIYR